MRWVACLKKRKRARRQIRLAVARESTEQNAHYLTDDFKEGIKASTERREPNLQGR